MLQCGNWNRGVKVYIHHHCCLKKWLCNNGIDLLLFHPILCVTSNKPSNSLFYLTTKYNYLGQVIKQTLGSVKAALCIYSKHNGQNQLIILSLGERYVDNTWMYSLVSPVQMVTRASRYKAISLHCSTLVWSCSSGFSVVRVKCGNIELWHHS